MKYLLLVLATVSLSAHAEFTFWKTTSSWNADASQSAVAAYKTFLELNDKTEKDCPYAGDAAYLGSALPTVIVNPLSIANYQPGNPEAALAGTNPAVYYPIACADGTTGIVNMALFKGTWTATQFFTPVKTSSFISLFALRDTDIGLSEVPADHYFNFELLPIDPGTGGKPFEGGIFLARETASEFVVMPMFDIPSINVKTGQWISADEVMTRLKNR